MTNGVAITYTLHDLDVSKVLQVTEFEIDLVNLEPNQVALQALANPINPSDLLQIKGVYTTPKTQQLSGKDVHIGGNEGLFKILKIGKDISGFNENDWVITKLSNFGTWRSHAIVTFGNEEAPVPIIKVKDSLRKDSKLTIAEAGTIGVNPPTAYQLLQNYVKFSPTGEDWVIQNAGASQVSKFVLQLAKHWKINVISVIRGGKPNQKAKEEELYALGATKVITEEQSQSEEYKTKIIPGWLKETGGKLKLALNSVGGALTNALIDHLSTDGYLVSYGQMTTDPIQYTSALQLYKNLTTKAYWLTRNTYEDPESKTRTIDSLVELYESGDLQPVSYSQVEYKLGDSSSDYLKRFLNAIENSSSDKNVVIYKD